VARVARAGDIFGRWRCWWSWPLGHAWELVDYFDRVSGKWAARARCVRCGRETGLAIGTARAGAILASKSLGTGMMSQSTPYAVPGSRKLGPSPETLQPSGFVVDLPEIGKVAVRHVRVRHPLGIHRNVYCAWRAGEEGPAAVSTELPVALARAVGRSSAEEWVVNVARQLEDELTARA
jgi:hypothetical protein